MKKIALKLFFALGIAVCLSSGFVQDCPKGGRKKDGSPADAEMVRFNTRKNKSAREPNTEPKIIRLASLKSGTKRTDDSKFWHEGAYVEMSDAYLIDYKEQGGETCNCYEADAAKSTGDAHINLGNKTDLANRNNNYYVIVEITPSYKKLHPDYNDILKPLKGKKVKVRGYLFYDYEHEKNSVNYCESCTDLGVWRKTCWEIHPVTYIGPATE